MSDNATSAIPEQASQTPRTRDIAIDRAKGVAILLVVFGHLVHYQDAGGHDWYINIKRFVYDFHMPLFMALSGYVYFYTNSTQRYFTSKVEYISKRAKRLLLPFLGFAIIVVAAKFISSGIFDTYDGVDNPATGMMAAITNAPENPALSIWYLFVLFIYSILTPLLVGNKNKYYNLIFALSIFIHFIPADSFLYIDRILQYYVFFLAGGLVLRLREAFDRYCIHLSIALSLLTIFSLFTIGRNFAPLFIYGFLVSIAIISAVRVIRPQHSDAITLLGSYSMVIYLLNTLFIGFFKAVILKTTPELTVHFPIYLFLLMIIGTLAPILTLVLLEKSKAFDWLTTYLK